MASLPGFEWSVPAPPGTVVSVMKDGKQVDSIDLSARPYTILGRKKELVHYAMDHETISRQHAVIGADSEGAVQLVDNKSTHGTYVNGQRITPLQRCLLQPNDVMTFGGSTRTYTLISANKPAAIMPPPPPRRKPVADDEALPPPGAGRSNDDDDDGFIHPSALRAKAAAGDDSFGKSAQTAAKPREYDGGAASIDADGRKRREAEIAAMVASLSQPIAIKSIPQASVTTAAATTHAAAVDESKIGKLLARASHASQVLGVDYPETKAMEADVDSNDEDDDELETANAEMEMAAAMGLPTAFGAGLPQRKKPENSGKRARKDDGSVLTKHSEEEEADGVDASDSKYIELGLPVSHEVVMPGGSKTITTMAVDPAGGRVITGSLDYIVRFYDFGGMDTQHKSFREITPQDGHPVVGLSFSPSGDRFLVGTTSSKPQIFDREGNKMKTFMKGDMYISDVSHTKGHVGAVSGARWHPVDKDYVFTSSLDSTVRLWNLNGKCIFDELLCTEIIKVKGQRDKRPAVTSMAVSADGRQVFAGLDEGSVHIYNMRTIGHKYLRPDLSIKAAHLAMEDAITSISLASNGTHVATRGLDQTVKVWDLRKFDDKSGPVVAITEVPTLHSSANSDWSPDSKLLAVPIDIAKGKGDGQICVFNIANVAAHGTSLSAGADYIYKSTVSTGVPAVVLRWHPRINQILIGCGNGSTHVLYDPSMSSRGALLSSARTTKRRDAIDSLQFATHGKIIAPNALPLFRDDVTTAGHKRKFSDLRHDRPAYPEAVRAAAMSGVEDTDFLKQHSKSFTQYFVENMQRATNIREQDPAAVLRSYAAKAETEPSAVGTAYAKTQPKRLLAATTIEEEEERAEADRQAFLKGNIAGK